VETQLIGGKMPSPFPGVNPYLERDDVWPDFHHRLIGRIADVLADQVDARNLVKIEEQLDAEGADEQACLVIRDRSSRELIVVMEVVIGTPT
jgi:hypothetical protein